jgi:tripartite-type tricarboxylate transporter receptor subunit TctC
VSRGESRFGRALWPALVLVLLAHAVSDVLHHPFLGDTGDAAIVDAHLTLWVPGTESGGPSEAVARAAAASLQLTGRPATVKLLSAGGAAGAVRGFLGDDPDGRPDDLLVVSSATVADLARGRSDPLLGDRASDAAEAELLLRRARPLAVLARDTLAIAVRPGSPLRSGTQLARALRRNPRAHLLAIEGDAWTKVQLGRLVQRAGVPGRVPYRAYPSGGEAALGLESGDADVVLAPGSALRAEVAGGRLRLLAWPRGAAAPQAWTAVLEAPRVRPGQHQRLADELARLGADPHWRAALRGAGRAAGARPGAPRGFLAARVDAATWLQHVTERVERG